MVQKFTEAEQGGFTEGVSTKKIENLKCSKCIFSGSQNITNILGHFFNTFALRAEGRWRGRKVREECLHIPLYDRSRNSYYLYGKLLITILRN